MKRFRIRIIHDYFDYKLLQTKLGNKNQILEENNGYTFVVKNEYMTPNKYIQLCANMMGVSVERLIESRDDDSLRLLKNKNLTPANCGLIYYDPYHNMQDGLHRAIVLNGLGYNKIKVMTIKRV